MIRGTPLGMHWAVESVMGVPAFCASPRRLASAAAHGR